MFTSIHFYDVLFVRRVTKMFGICLILFYLIIRAESFLKKDQGFGHPTVSSRFPFIGVLVKMDEESKTNEPLCAVSLLDSKHVITSATCLCRYSTELPHYDFRQKKYMVYFGLDGESLENANRKVGVLSFRMCGEDDCEIFPLPFTRDKHNKKQADQAVLQLTEEIEEKQAKPIELADISESAEVYTHLTFSWSFDDSKKIHKIRLFKTEGSQMIRDKYSSYFIGSISFGGELTKEYLKFLGEPAIILKKSRYLLIGFVSRPMNVTVGYNPKNLRIA